MHAVAALYHQLSSRRRRQLLALLLMMLVGTLAELLTIGAALPFLALIILWQLLYLRKEDSQ